MKQESAMTGFTFATCLRRGTATLALITAFGLALPAHAHDLPFAISVDGTKLDGSTIPTDQDRATDVDLEQMDIQVKFDGLGVKPTLNVATFPPQTSYKVGEEIRFLASFNYGAWIEQGEIRIYDHKQEFTDKPFAVIPISKQGAAEWKMPADAPTDMDYVLRVYDEDGRYDETRPLPLATTDSDLALSKRAKDAVAPGYGDDRTAVRNISVFGGAVTVFGKNIPEGHEVTVAGEPVPVDGNNGFVIQRIFPSGKHGVDISVIQDGVGVEFSREVVVPENEWFYIGLADFTAGHQIGGKVAPTTNSDHFDNVWTRGRLAFYLKGKIKGKYILTASADTGEGSFKDMIKGLDGKDPQEFLKRINPNDYYPVYGDDSTAIADAPTRGKFYVRFEKGPSSVTWGNFRTNITGTHFMRNTRELYGANGVYRSDAVTNDGEAKVAGDIYAAQPSTVPQNDVFRGTGGSAYFLKHQDITIGSETITIETRNAITGWVVERRTLVYREDYDFDYVLGVLTLRSPLTSTTSNGNENFVVARYDYTPVVTDKDGYIAGGRAQAWLGDHVRVGVSGMVEKTQGADQKIYGADVRLQKSKDTYIEGEVARSEGPGFGSSYSADGGLSLQNNASAGVAGTKANAWRIEAGVSLDELTTGTVEGHVGARIEHHDAGFASLDTQATKTRQTWGLDADIKVGESATVKSSYSESDISGGERARQGDVRVNVPLSEHVSVEPYGRYTAKTNVAATTEQHGERGDVGAKLIYTWNADKLAYVFGQGTVARTETMQRDNRVGVGGKVKITDRITASGEISEGTQGIDASATLSYEPSADRRYYLGYRLDPARSLSSSYPYTLDGSDLGSIVVGARHHFNDQWLAHGEDNFDMFGARRAVTQTYGITYTPTKEWALDGSIEVGRVYDNTINPTTNLKNVSFERQAGSVSATYHGEDGIDGTLKGEARRDYADDGSSEIMSYLLRAGFGAKMSADWRALGNLDVIIADATKSTLDSDYKSASLGFAYRPADNDRLNALVKYAYIYDNPGADQVGVDGTSLSPAQSSNIFTTDASYDLTKSLNIGGKYGFRIGETRDRDAGAQWQAAKAHLGIVRADLHIVSEWDALIEGRILWSPTSDSTDYGFLVAIYRQLGDNFKVGIGYNFGSFSDNLADLSHDDRGVFLNVIGKF
jgi:hypothetical protein